MFKRINLNIVIFAVTVIGILFFVKSVNDILTVDDYKYTPSQYAEPGDDREVLGTRVGPHGQMMLVYQD